MTERDREILLALDRCPLTVRQLLALSETFALPFTSQRRVQERLQTLARRGLVRAAPFFLPGWATSNYFVRTLDGWRTLHDDEAPLPSRRSCEPLSHARLPHWHALADFLVHTLRAAHRAGIALEAFHPENALRLEVAGQSRYPDSAFRLVRPDDGKRFPFFVELDNATQPVYAQTAGSWQGKIRFYEAYRDHCRRAGKEDAFRVLVLSTGGGQRVQHILQAASALMVRKDRSIFYGLPLATYLGQDAPLTAPLFRDNLGRLIPLVPAVRQTLPPAAAPGVALANSGAPC